MESSSAASVPLLSPIDEAPHDVTTNQPPPLPPMPPLPVATVHVDNPTIFNESQLTEASGLTHSAPSVSAHTSSATSTGSGDHGLTGKTSDKTSNDKNNGKEVMNENEDEDFYSTGFGIGDDEDDEEKSQTLSINHYSSDQYDLNERVSYFMERRLIVSPYRSAVEAVYMVKALSIVRSQKAMKKPDIALKVQEIYKELIKSIPEDRFGELGLKQKMMQGYFRAKKNSPAGILAKAEDIITKVRGTGALIKGIGTPLHRIPSGKSLSDIRMEFIIEKYKENVEKVM